MKLSPYVKGALAVVLPLISLHSAAMAGFVTIGGGTLEADAHPLSSEFDSATVSDFGNGTLTSLYSGGTNGNGNATLLYDLSMDASGVEFDFVSRMTRATTHDASTDVNLVFRADQQMNYDISGYLELLNGASHGGMYSSVVLVEKDLLNPGNPDVILFRDSDRLLDVQGITTLTVGVLDEGNDPLPAPSLGSATGILKAGYAYQLLISQDIFDDESFFSSPLDDPHADAGGFASGRVTMTLTPTPVPEPSSMILLGLGACSLGVASRRRLKRRSEVKV